LRHLEPMRASRVWLPSTTPAGKTDLQLHRIMVSGGQGGVVEFQRGP
jgi:hypothetical protein